MSEAPERIWADRGPKGGWLYRDQKMPDTQHEYVRADRIEALERQVKELREQSDRFCDKYLAALKRVEAAEADNARLSEANRELHRRAQAAEGKLQRAEHAAREQIDILTSLATKLGHWPVGLSRAKTAMEQWIDAALSGSGSVWREPNDGHVYSASDLARLLEGRDAFIVSKGLWGEFTASLAASPAAPQQGGAPTAKTWGEWERARQEAERGE